MDLRFDTRRIEMKTPDHCAICNEPILGEMEEWQDEICHQQCVTQEIAAIADSEADRLLDEQYMRTA